MTTTLPENMSFGYVSGRFVFAVADGADAGRFPDGLPAQGRVTFTPSAGWLLDVSAAPDPVTVMPRTVECTLDVDGYLIDPEGVRGVYLVATDDPDLNPTGWTYTVTIAITGYGTRSFSIEVPSGSVLDLTTLSPVAAANGVTIIRGEQGEVGPEGPEGPVGPAGGSDAAFSAWVEDPGSLTRGSLNEAFVNIGELVVNAADYGASPAASAAANVTAFANAEAAALALGSDARLLIPPGNYPINGTVRFKCHLDAEQATLTYTGSGTALVIGEDTSGVVTARKTFRLPRVVKAALGWDGTSVGVKLINLNTCEVYVPFVQYTEYGLVVVGKGQGSVHNNIYLGALWHCHKELVLDPDATGWVNQNVFYGGRLAMPTVGSIPEAGADDTDAWMVKLGPNAAASPPNNNTFIGLSLEGNVPPYYRLDIRGRYNVFLNCRFEKMGGSSRVIYRADALYNQILYGYDSNFLTEEFEAGSLKNVMFDRDGSAISGKGSAGQSIADSTWATLTSWSQSSVRATYSGAGLWTPRQGRWRIVATAAFAGGGSGVRQMRILAGATVLDVAQHGSAADIQTLKASGTAYFDGATTFAVQVRQTSGAALSTNASDGYQTVYAEYLGP